MLDKDLEAALNTCPICGEPARMSCKCPVSDSLCKNNHRRHYCTVHQKVVKGKADHSRNTEDCNCVQLWFGKDIKLCKICFLTTKCNYYDECSLESMKDEIIARFNKYEAIASDIPKVKELQEQIRPVIEYWEKQPGFIKVGDSE